MLYYINNKLYKIELTLPLESQLVTGITFITGNDGCMCITNSNNKDHILIEALISNAYEGSGGNRNTK